MRTTILVLSFSVCVIGAIGFSISSESHDITKFIILHNNDMHSRFEETSANSDQCTQENAKKKKCYGGFARIAHVLKNYRTEAKNGGTPVIYLNAGDTYTGTSWFAVFKGNITADFLNKLAPEAISLGNHELDDGVAGLVPFLEKAKFPVLAANLDLTNVPELAKNILNSTVVNIGDKKIGIIGYLTPNTKHLVPPNNIGYYSEIDSINNEAKILKSKGVNIIIALGHSGLEEDQAIAQHCPEVDVVIGGHDNSFLYNGKQPDSEPIKGPYPTVVIQSSGKKVPVVQAYAYTKYLGKLNVEFDHNGNLIKFDGQPILLDASVKEDEDILELLEVYRPKITEMEKTVIGYTNVELDGSFLGCRKRECTLGNLITDAMVYARAKELSSNRSDAVIAFFEGGGIRNSIGVGPITQADILAALPYGNDIYITQVSGETIFKSLELCLYNRDHNGGFLQMSGVQVVYDLTKSGKERVVSVQLLCADCDKPTYTDIDMNAKYNIIVPEFLLNGGDGHFFNSPSPRRLTKIDVEVLKQYIQDYGIVSPKLEKRVTIIEN